MNNLYEYLTKSGWREKTLVTDWGHEDFWICPVCSSIVLDPLVHEKIHTKNPLDKDSTLTYK